MVGSQANKQHVPKLAPTLTRARRRGVSVTLHDDS